jgi:hypothetical protein|tara:strand:- start:322 stop:777 length:456 start_codon:yes stop_codon:yes gene_type:complete
MKENKLTPQQTFLRISVVLLITLWAIIFISSCDNKNNSHIEKVIKKHNSIKDSWTNVKHPTVPKPASSQSTVIYGDSVRVIPKNSTIVKVQTPLNADIPCQNLDVLNTVDDILHWEIQNNTLHIYTKKDSINDEIERWNYIRSLDEEGWEE